MNRYRIQARRLCRILTLVLAAAAMLGSLALAGPAFAGSPLLNNVLPVAGQRGTEVRATFYGQRLRDATDILFHTPGISFKDIEVQENNRITATLVIAPDAPTGEHQLRVVTATGVSEMQTFQVVDRPLTEEDESANNSFDQAQPVEQGQLILGRITREDVDYFRVTATKGQRLSIEANSMRLGRGMSDVSLAVLNEQRFEIAGADDTALLTQDPFVSFIAPEDGTYTIVIRDSAYQGDNNNWYLMHIGPFPRPSAVYPLGGLPGETVNLRFLGDPAGVFSQEIVLPAEPDNRFAVFPERDGAVAPSPHRLRVNHLPNVLEQDYSANNHRRDFAGVAPAVLPVAFNGIVSETGQEDYFKFSARKNQKLRIDTYAGRLGSPLDTVVNVLNSEGKYLEGNDDGQGADSVFEFTVPEDGEYLLRVRDHLRRGGADFVYRVEVGERERGLRTYLHEYDRNNPQVRQGVAVPRGNRFAALLRVDRDRVSGDLDVILDGLPQGVGFSGRCPDGRVDMPVVFEADANSPTGFVVVDLLAASRADDPAQRVIGGMRHQVPTIQANPNRTVYYQSELTSLPIAVTEPAPFWVDAVQPTAPLVRGGKMELRINVTRDEGYTGRVRLHMLWKPPGVSAANRVDVSGEQDHGLYEISANGNAPLRRWPLAIVAFGDDIRGGSVWVSTQLFEVKVTEPYITGSIDMAACEQGETVQVVVKLEHPQPWEGEAQLRLLGLPAETTVQTVTVTPGMEQAVFTVNTTGQTPPGQHKSLLCEIDIPVDGEAATHLFARGGTFRVDRPRRPQNAQPTPAPAQPATETPRQLSRLEQLRLEAEREQRGDEE